jgi:hypothetical protein
VTTVFKISQWGSQEFVSEENYPNLLISGNSARAVHLQSELIGILVGAHVWREITELLEQKNLGEMLTLEHLSTGSQRFR